MTTLPDVAPPAQLPDARPVSNDHRGSPIPTFSMIATRFKELRKRRGLMIALLLVTIGFPTIFLAVRLILHAAAPHTYGPAGGYDVFTGMTSGVLYTFGFIVAATLGCTAGSVDLTEGMFRHLVVTGRSRLALYLARIPAGLAIIVSLVAAGFAIVCLVCTFAAPTTLNFQGVTVPVGLSKAGLDQWAAVHVPEVVCDIGINGPPSQTAAFQNFNNVQNYLCQGPNGGPGNGGGVAVQKGGENGPPASTPTTPAQDRAAAVYSANLNFSEYSTDFLRPSGSLMLKAGLWLELEATIGFIVGLGLGSLIGQRTVAVIMMVVLEIILTPILSRARIPHFINAQRAVVGLATAHLTPGGLPVLGGGGGGPGGGSGNAGLLPESTTVAVCVIIAWLVGWTVLGAWRMMKRDA